MGALGPVLVLALVLVLVVLAVLVGLGRRRDVVPRREWRLVQATRLLGLVGGLAAAMAMLRLREHWVGSLSEVLAPAAFGLVVVTGVALGEVAVRPRRTTGPRTASLRPRTVRSYAPRVTTALVATMGGLLAATLLLTTVTADRADDGRLRALACRAGGVTSVVTPYPGLYYAAPLAVVLVLTLAVAAAAARRVVTRPRGLATTDHGDDVLRRRSITVIVAAVGVAVSASEMGVAAVAAEAIHRVSDGCPMAGSSTLTVGLAVTAVAALLLALWCLVRVVSNDSLERPWT